MLTVVDILADLAGILLGRSDAGSVRTINGRVFDTMYKDYREITVVTGSNVISASTLDWSTNGIEFRFDEVTSMIIDTRFNKFAYYEDTVTETGIKRSYVDRGDLREFIQKLGMINVRGVNYKVATRACIIGETILRTTIYITRVGDLACSFCSVSLPGILYEVKRGGWIEVEIIQKLVAMLSVDFAWKPQLKWYDDARRLQEKINRGSGDSGASTS